MAKEMVILVSPSGIGTATRISTLKTWTAVTTLLATYAAFGSIKPAVALAVEAAKNMLIDRPRIPTP